MAKHLLSVAAFVIVTFGVQGLNHFVVNTDYYANIEFARAEPVMALGFLAMIVQGIILTLAMSKIAPVGATIQKGLVVSLAFGLFLGSYIAFAEPAKYAAPSITTWMLTEGLVSTVQFVIFGVLLGIIHRKLS